jgi:hypothetical protein
MIQTVVITVVALFLTVPANWVVRLVLRLVRVETPKDTNRAGRWIGILERLLVFVLVISGQAAAAGIVVAAKSILRFPEISSKPQQIAPEFVLVGSLASWLLAFAAGAAVIAGVGL